MRCVFCFNLAVLTREHIWGEWIKDHVDLTMNGYGAAFIPIPRPGERGEPITHQRAGDPTMAQVEIVCADCNSGFLSQIQNRAKPYLIPLFKGETSRLDEAGQAIISSWIAMATMTSAYVMKDPRQIAIPQNDRDWLRHTLTAPQDWGIWIGHCDAWARNEQWLKVSIPILQAESLPDSISDDDRLPNTQSTTFKVGNLFAFAMSSSTYPAFVAKWRWRPVPNAVLSMQRIWPALGILGWPTFHIGSDDAEAIAKALFTYSEDLGRTVGYI